MEFEVGNLESQVRELYSQNHHRGRLNGVEYDYTCPSPFSYPHQWLWDSSFHAIVLSSHDPERAKREIKSLMVRQRENGFIPATHIWESVGSMDSLFFPTGITQPPVIPIAAEAIFERTKDWKFLERIYPNLKNFMDWIYTERDKNGNGLPEIIHPWEDGDDGNPSFDIQLGMKKEHINSIENWFMLYKILGKYSLMEWDSDKIFQSRVFRAETGLFSSIYAKGLLSMAELADSLGKNEDASVFRKRYELVKRGILDLMWNNEDKTFYDLDQNSEQVHVKGISTLMPLILPDLPEQFYKPVIEKHLLNPKEFWTPYPVASIARNEKTFRPGKGYELWRGPVWINTNWFLAKALQNYGYQKEANVLISKTQELTRKGFREFYNPFSGEGYGAKNFGWSTLVLEMSSV